MSTPIEVAGRYQLDSRLGAGGMSTVFLGLDTVLERRVAIKLLAEHLAEDDTFVARFRREALAAARLQHPNVVQVYDSGRDADSGRHYIVMEYVDGPSCADLLRDRGSLPVEDCVSYLRDGCRGLDYAHRAGVVHRDVKPGNLLVAEDSGMVKLADFGIAKAAEQSRVTQVGSVLGTAAYLSPEQARGEEAGPASDIYSLGVCGYQFLTGRLPFEYSSLTELALKQQEAEVAPITELRPEVPPELDRAVRACLARDPNARYGSALEVAEAFEAGLHGEVTAATQMLTGGAAGAQADGGAGDATVPLTASGTEATRAVRTSEVTRRPPPPVRPSTSAPAPARAAPAARARPRRRRRGLGRMFAVLLLVAAGVVAAFLIASSTGSAPQRPIDEETVSRQLQELRDYVRQHSR
ncbi:MAG TPA: protein kinase [Thermoleophilaceae bacterium]|nr:protein kinase [Thermoleophilaceae bacterium]